MPTTLQPIVFLSFMVAVSVLVVMVIVVRAATAASTATPSITKTPNPSATVVPTVTYPPFPSIIVTVSAGNTMVEDTFDYLFPDATWAVLPQHFADFAEQPTYEVFWQTPAAPLNNMFIKPGKNYVDYSIPFGVPPGKGANFFWLGPYWAPPAYHAPMVFTAYFVVPPGIDSHIVGTATAQLAFINSANGLNLSSYAYIFQLDYNSVTRSMFTINMQTPAGPNIIFNQALPTVPIETYLELYGVINSDTMSPPGCVVDLTFMNITYSQAGPAPFNMVTMGGTPPNTYLDQVGLCSYVATPAPSPAGSTTCPTIQFHYLLCAKS